MPGIRELRIVNEKEVASMLVTAADTVSVSLKPGCQWGRVHGTRMAAESTGEKTHRNKITARLAGWPCNADTLAKGRYVATWTDNHGRRRMCGFGEPLRMTVRRTEPEEPSGQYGAEINLENESEFGFLELAE